MNRAEYRRMKKESAKKKNVYTLTQEQLDAMLLDREITTMNLTMTCTIGMLLLALRDVFGFSAGRIDRLMENFMVKYECFLEDADDKTLASTQKYDFITIINTLKDETGYDLIGLLEKDIRGNVRLRSPEEYKEAT